MKEIETDHPGLSDLVCKQNEKRIKSNIFLAYQDCGVQSVLMSQCRKFGGN